MVDPAACDGGIGEEAEALAVESAAAGALSAGTVAAGEAVAALAPVPALAARAASALDFSAAACTAAGRPPDAHAFGRAAGAGAGVPAVAPSEPPVAPSPDALVSSVETATDPAGAPPPPPSLAPSLPGSASCTRYNSMTIFPVAVRRTLVVASWPPALYPFTLRKTSPTARQPAFAARPSGLSEMIRGRSSPASRMPSFESGCGFMRFTLMISFGAGSYKVGFFAGGAAGAVVGRGGCTVSAAAPLGASDIWVGFATAAAGEPFVSATAPFRAGSAVGVGAAGFDGASSGFLDTRVAQVIGLVLPRSRSGGRNGAASSLSQDASPLVWV